MRAPWVALSESRHGDQTIDLKQRAEIANTAKRLDGGIGADLFISIHHNAGSKGSKDEGSVLNTLGGLGNALMGGRD